MPGTEPGSNTSAIGVWFSFWPLGYSCAPGDVWLKDPIPQVPHLVLRITVSSNLCFHANRKKEEDDEIFHRLPEFKGNRVLMRNSLIGLRIF